MQGYLFHFDYFHFQLLDVLNLFVVAVEDRNRVLINADDADFDDNVDD